MPPITITPAAVIAVFVFVVGSGTVGRWLAGRFRAAQRKDLEDALAGKWATMDELNGLGAKVTGLQKIAETANDQAEAALTVAQAAEARAARIESQVMPALRELAAQIAEQGRHLAKQTGVLETFMDEYRSRK